MARPYRIYFSWRANSEVNLAGYKLYVGRSSGAYTVPGSPVDLGNVTTTSYQVSDTTDQNPWFFALTSYNTLAQESGFSAELEQRFLTYAAVEGF